MKTRVFVVDEHAIVRWGLGALIARESDLELCGEAEDCASATSAVTKLRPDVVVADIELRGNSGGLELIKNIQAFDAGIKIVVLSGHDESIYALRALRAGAKAFVSKHEAVAKVLEAVRKVQLGQVFVGDQVASLLLANMVSGHTPQTDSKLAGLSDRELEVATLIGTGLATREISNQLFMSVKTVETHRAHIKAKVNVSSASQLVHYCVRWVEDNKRREARGGSRPPMLQFPDAGR